LYHAGKDNGKLPVAFQNFQDFGVHCDAIAPAVREVTALGFARMTQQGRAGNGEFCIPNIFALTHLPTERGQVAATNDWTLIKTVEEAMNIAETARKAPHDTANFAEKAPAKNKTPHPKNVPQLGTETVLQEPSETVLLSLSRGGGRGRGGRCAKRLRAVEPETKLSGLLAWTIPVLTELKWDDYWQRYSCEVVEKAACGLRQLASTGSPIA
jgi:hypothetical protein